MTTWIRPSRLLTVWVLVGLAGTFLFVLAGCSTTSGARTGAASKKMKTFLSVGDKPLPVVSGEPGSSVAADAEPAPSRRNRRAPGRISGRVFDADGKPVPDARVRLAVSGAPGGKVVRASTDRSGAFTLHGLRPGSSYTVIAESDGDDGTMSGRANARTADTDVRISLGPQDPAAARAESPSRVKSVSDRETADDDDAKASDLQAEPSKGTAPGRDRSRVNEEDLPPATEAAAFVPIPSSSSRSRAATSNRRARPATVQTDAWRKGIEDQGSAASDPALANTVEHGVSGKTAAPVDPEARGIAGTTLDGGPPVDDVPNPLPPALERAEDQASASRARTARPSPGAVSSDPDPFAEEPPRLAAKPPSGSTRTNQPTRTRQLAAFSAFESPTRPTEPPASAPPVDHAPGALVVVPETFAPVMVHENDPFAAADTPPDGPFSTSKAAIPQSADGPAPEPAPLRSNRPRRNAVTAARPRPVRQPTTTTASVRSPEASATASASNRRPTWGEIALATGPLPPLEGQDAPVPGPHKKSGDSRRELASRGDERPAPKRVAGTATDPVAPECEYDDRHRRLVDFRLPALDGKPLRFQDIDADLVLIDFWGTWCQPCLRAVPHLVDLQKRIGNKRLAIVGIACEQDAPGQSARRVAATAERLKMNYPILLSRNDGSCPLQEALHVQAFPTMVLLDRQGRILWRDQGSTPATLARLDRMIASTPGDTETRRY